MVNTQELQDVTRHITHYSDMLVEDWTNSWRSNLQLSTTQTAILMFPVKLQRKAPFIAQQRNSTQLDVELS